MIRVSVLINNFNYGRYLGQAIRSALEQDFPAAEREVVVVDDGSTDDSRGVAASFGDRIRYHFQPNAGQAGALTTGFRLAQGTFVALLDADDFWKPEKLRTVIAPFEGNPELGLVQHRMQTVDRNGRELPTYFETWPPRYTRVDLDAGRAKIVGTSGLCFRREYVLELLPIPEDLRFSADEYLYNHLFFNAAAANIPQVLGFRRVHGSNLYADTLLKPDALRWRARIRSSLDQHLEDRYRSHALEFPPALRTAGERDRLFCEMMASRLEGDAVTARRLKTQLLLLYPPGAYRCFKCTTLGVAMASPRLYACIFDFYRKHRLFGSLRSLFFPFEPKVRPDPC